ncbi:very long chain fatty acid elongase 4-like [Nomia melanderi]|uniref:very long chain fatty acid elongase 4-like n=1 Tax=Nomia melanderi TaxID=2448451 RepID=UPI003FCD0216
MGLAEIYYHYNTELADKRTNDWFMISSPVPFLLLTALYLYFVLDFGPKYMKDRQPYSLKTFIYWYNIFQIISNALIIYHAFDAGWFKDGFLFCRTIDYSFDRNPYKLTQVAWYTMCLKMIDYIETILFVLRKKNKQVSFLHLYHHVSTAFIVCGSVKYFPNGHAITLVVVNCVIHVIMYTYYLLTSYGPEMQKTLAPFKRMVTIAQMLSGLFQF